MTNVEAVKKIVQGRLFGTLGVGEVWKTQTQFLEFLTVLYNLDIQALYLYFEDNIFVTFAVKVGKSQKQFMVSSILPKKERNSLSWASSLLRISSEFRSFFGRIEKTIVTIMCSNDELSWTVSWVGCLLIDSALFILFAENSQILLKISVIPILLTLI